MIAQAIRANLAVVQQGIALLSTLDPAGYATRDPAVFNSTVGGHLRHVLEHYTSFLDGLAAAAGIDYEKRARDLRIERECAHARACLALVAERLEATLALSSADHPVRVRMESPPAIGADAWSASSVSRELEFLLSHTIHHYALIAVICTRLGHQPAADFGMAPSTLRHQAAQAAG
jgi:uncharacterized damage-inducible protein DinB